MSSDLEVMDRCLNLAGRYVVDAGCGAMGLSRAMAERGARVLAIDPDPAQATLNRQATLPSEVRFEQSGADALPVADRAVDGIVFGYSLHHIPKNRYPAVFAEVARVLKPGGFVYVIEPVAAGDLHEITALFHDETVVRADAQQALERLAMPLFETTKVLDYDIPVHFASFEHFAEDYGAKSYNAGYSQADVQADAVRGAFERLGRPSEFNFKAPMRLTWLQGLRGAGSNTPVSPVTGVSP